MCGIAGFVTVRPDRAGPAWQPVLTAMQDAIAHRGPDDSGQYFDTPPPEQIAAKGACALGFRRLSIVDLSGGHQPMGNEDGSVQVVFNGEIYNHQDLRRELVALGHTFATHSDTEVLVHGWEAWGEALLSRCNGMFDLAIWDARQRSLLLARDRYGKKPLFVAVADGGDTLVFGSELSAVRRHPAVSQQVSAQGLLSLFALDYVASPWSMLHDVHALQPGELWRWQVQPGAAPQLTRRRWHLHGRVDAALGRLTDSEALDALERTLDAAVDRRLMADVPLGVFLSGGIDSSVVTALAARHRPAHALDTFSIAFEDKSFDESAHADVVARHLGTRHHVQLVDAAECLSLVPELLGKLDQPLADASLIPTYALARFARQTVTVALGGDGGDEAWLGYPTFAAEQVARLAVLGGGRHWSPRLLRLLDRLPVSESNWGLDQQLRRFVSGLSEPTERRHFAWIGGLPLGPAAHLLHPDVRRALLDLPGARELARPGVDALLADTWADALALAPDTQTALGHLYGRFYLGDGVLQKVDRATMLVGLEARAPLLDPAVMDLAASLPARMKVRGRSNKWLLRQLAGRLLPASIVARKKKGFGVPLSAWLRGPLRAYLTDQLAPPRLAQTGLLDVAACQRVLDEHLQRKADHRKTLWALLCLVAFVDRQRAEPPQQPVG